MKLIFFYWISKLPELCLPSNIFNGISMNKVRSFFPTCRQPSMFDSVQTMEISWTWLVFIHLVCRRCCAIAWTMNRYRKIDFAQFHGLNCRLELELTKRKDVINWTNVPMSTKCSPRMKGMLPIDSICHRVDWHIRWIHEPKVQYQQNE